MSTSLTISIFYLILTFFDERMNVFRATQIDIVEFSNKIIGLNEKTMTLYLLKTKEKIKV